MNWQNAIITRIETLSPRVKNFSFRLPEPLSFQPGQHVLLRLTAPDGYRAQRSYSIASAPRTGGAEELELAIERLDDGEVSPFMHDAAKVNDKIELGGPIGGHFKWSPHDGGPVLFIGGGSGVTPFMSMLRYRAAIGSRVAVTLIFSARQREELLFFDELSNLAASKDGFDLIVTLTREAAYPFRAGRIDTAFIADAIAAIKTPLRQVLICGSNPFVEAAAEGTIAAAIDPALIKTERYGVADVQAEVRRSHRGSDASDLDMWITHSVDGYRRERRVCSTVPASGLQTNDLLGCGLDGGERRSTSIARQSRDESGDQTPS